MNSQEQSSNVERLGYSYEEAVTASGLSRSTLQRLVADGKIRAIPIGRRRIIPRADLERLINGGADAA